MVKQPHTIGINEPFSRAWEIMQAYRIRHLPVLGMDFRIKGIISQRDIYRTISPKKSLEEQGFSYSKEDLDKFVLEHVMTKDVQSLRPQDTLGSAMDLIVKKKLGCIPIVSDQGFLEGILTQIDLLRAVAGHYL